MTQARRSLVLAVAVVAGMLVGGGVQAAPARGRRGPSPSEPDARAPGARSGPAARPSSAPTATVTPTHRQPRSFDCDVVHGLTVLDATQRGRLHAACEGADFGHDAATYAGLFRLVSSSRWHAGILGALLHHRGRASLTVWADGDEHGLPVAAQVQEHLDKMLPTFAAGDLCPELREGQPMRALLEAIEEDEEPTDLPFDAELAGCLGVPATSMTGLRLLSVRADGLEDVTVVMGTRDFVHAQRLEVGAAIEIDRHRFFVFAVPDAAAVAAFGYQENLELPVIWRRRVGRNQMIWGAPPRQSCVDLSVTMDEGTALYLDGVRVDGGTEPVCAGPEPAGADEGRGEASDDTAPASSVVDRTVAITLDLPDSGIPDHEITALTCVDGRAVVRHQSPIAATAPASRLRTSNDCEPVRLDLASSPTTRVAVLGVSKLDGCEATPLWASDVSQRVRHILGRDMAHPRRSYVNFSAYAEATEALATLEAQMDRKGDDGESREADADTLIGTAAAEAWRQGIDTLVSFAVQCTPRGTSKAGEAQWSYTMRATAIDVGDLFARGFYDRQGLDLEDFIRVESVGFARADEQDASLAALLDRVFKVERPRFIHSGGAADYRRGQTLRLSGYFPGAGAPSPAAAPSDDGASPKTAPRSSVSEEITVRVYPLRRVSRGGPDRDQRVAMGAVERPPVCDELIHRGVRSSEALAAVRKEITSLSRRRHGPAEVKLRRSRDELDTSSNAEAAVHQGQVYPRRPGWYLVVVDVDDDEVIDDAVCIEATAHAVDLWTEMSFSGGPLAYAIDGSRANLYLRTRMGATWYTRRRWLGIGGTLGYGFTSYGGPRADWKDLDVAFADALEWQQHALLVAPHIEVRSRAAFLPFETRARLGVALDGGLVDTSRIDPELEQFRNGSEEDIVLDIDGDLNLDLALGVPLGPVQVQGLFIVSWSAFNDPLDRSGSSVTSDGNLYFGFGLAVSGGRR